MGKIKAFTSVLGLLLLVSLSALAWPSKYDLLIQRETRRYMPGVDWLRFKSQLIVESALKHDAKSHVGAAGLAQIMPKTAEQIGYSLGFKVNPYNPKHAIQAGAYYMGWLRGQWSWNRPEYDRQALAESSYNAGLKHILSAQKACGNAVLYTEIIKCLPAITGRHATETLNYVERINKNYADLRNR